jgi:hypothetical protein
VVFDIDLFIWIQRGNRKAARLVEREEERLLSLQTYVELLQGAQNQQQHESTKSFLKTFGFATLPLTENIRTLVTRFCKWLMARNFWL